MRMRRKKNLDEKIRSIPDRLIVLKSGDLNFNTSVLKKEYIDTEAVFGRKAPLILEVGCGMGGFACELARREPDKDIIGVEMNANVAYAAAKKAKDEGIENFLVLCCKAEYLPKYLPDGTVSRIYLNFSCPFPKSDYESHRLTSARFLGIYGALLVPGGDIHQKTDNARFFEYSIESFSENGWKLRNVSLDLHASGFEGNIVTEYEQKFLNEGKPIYRLEAYKLK